MIEITSTIRPADSATQAFRVVLHATARGELVTHVENVLPNGQAKPSRDFYWGHYFSGDLTPAMADFIARCEKYGLEAIQPTIPKCSACGAVLPYQSSCGCFDNGCE